tara:strand:- start:3822 stop:4088 length:267 start_codon:yes stop_codon:yes gene_type:complete
MSNASDAGSLDLELERVHRLAAAAPDLLDALKIARDRIFWSECDQEYDDSMAFYGGPTSIKGRAVLAQVDQAIAKAEDRIDILERVSF